MADPVTIGLGVGALVGGASALFGSKSSTPAAATPDVPPDPSQPATLPGSKPAAKSQQQSFLSGAASLQSGGASSGVGGLTGSSGGKSLLGQ